MAGPPFTRFARWATQAAGSITAFVGTLVLLVAWLVVGPWFRFSDGWLLFMTAVASIAAFVMVFVIQYAQNRETKAIQLKLNEVIAAIEGASNRLIDVEEVSDKELDELSDRFQRLAEEVRRVRGRRIDVKTSIERQAEATMRGPALRPSPRPG